MDYRGLVVRKFLDHRKKFINAVVNTIQDEEYVKSSRTDRGRHGFTRHRKLTFTHLIVLLTQGLSRSITREMSAFYQKVTDSEFSLHHVTKGAFTQARAKLKPEAFVTLNQVGIKSFYEDASYRIWHGFRVLAIDGSTAVLPNHQSVREEFGTTKFGPYADVPRSVARMSLLYDVLNFTVLDGQIDRYDASERELAGRHLDFLKPKKDLVILDRGYASFSLMFEMQQRRINYCIRLRDDWWLEVKKMIAAGEKDKKVIFQLGQKDQYLLKQYNTTNDKIRCRLVIGNLPGGGIEVLCTSILDNTVLPYESFASLYHLRWNLEEGYKLFKARLELEAFSGKTALAVKQDFFAKIFMMTTTAVLSFPVEEKLREDQQHSTRKHKYQLNRTTALATVKNFSVQIFIKKLIRPALRALDKILTATVEIVRPNRRNPRNKIKKKPPSMNYKQL